MKNLPILFLILALLLPASFTDAAQRKATRFHMFNGTNIAHWLSQNGDRRDNARNFLQEKDIKQIASWGFDHVRIPIDEVVMFNADGSVCPEMFSLLKDALHWCDKYGLTAVVDLHVLRSHHFNNSQRPLFTDAKAQDRFIEVWQLISRELKGFSVHKVAYELMNEPVADKPEEWNRIAMRCYKEVRKLEPRRVIVLGSNRWQAFDELKNLEIPKDDPNIILSFHYYNPFALTHHKASWTDLKDYDGGVHYPGQVITKGDLDKVDKKMANRMQWWTTQVYNRDRIRNDFNQALAVAKAHHLRLYCGEYGAYDPAPKADRMRWYHDMKAVFDELGIAHANWNYKSGGFGLVGSDGTTVDKDLVKTLTNLPK